MYNTPIRLYVTGISTCIIYRTRIQADSNGCSVAQSVEHWFRDPGQVNGFDCWRHWSCIFCKWFQLGLKMYTVNLRIYNQKKVGVRPIRIVWSNVSSIGLALDLSIFRFVSLLCLYAAHYVYYIPGGPKKSTPL